LIHNVHVTGTEPDDEPVALHDHALDNLRFIRSTMERAGTFTAVPGWGTVAVGITACVAAALAGNDVSSLRWLTIWLGEAGLAWLISSATILTKTRALGFSVTAAPMRRFLLAFLPTLIAGALITAALVAHDQWTLLPATWLMLYGAAVAAGGALSVRLIPFMGLSFMIAGVIAYALPVSATAIVLGSSFGGLHLIYGVIIARRYGG
jgi:hypothetical protein